MGSTRNETNQVRVLDLFSGAGGLALGFHEIGPVDVLQAIESDLSAAATYATNFPETPVYAGKIEDWLEQETVPSADLVIGGPPCQGFSLLGKRDELDLRNFLWLQYVEVISRSRPLVFILENVPGFRDSPQFQQLLEATEPDGLLQDYRLEYDVLNAADFGAAQLRKRVLVVGSLKDRPAPGLPVGDATMRKSVEEAWAGLNSKVTDVDLPRRSVSYSGKELPGPFKSRELHLTRNFTAISLARFGAIPAGGNRFDIPEHLLAECWRNHSSGAGDVMGRLSWAKPSVTIRTEFFKPEKGRYLHPDEDRSITHAEAARLQGFPDDFEWVGSKTAIARQIGNAVPVELSEAIARHVLDYLQSIR